MYRTGDKAVYMDRDVVVLTSQDWEVLIYIDFRCIKWVPETALTPVNNAVLVS